MPTSMRSLATGNRDLAGAATWPRHPVFVLWTTEARAGREEGAKDRPCAIVLAIAAAQNRKRVIVLPITHTAPHPPDEGIELPQAVKTRLGLDHERSWVMVSEGNDFIWPGPDLRPLTGERPDSISYGLLPPRLFRAIQSRFLERARAGQAGTTKRTERCRSSRRRYGPAASGRRTSPAHQGRWPGLRRPAPWSRTAPMTLSATDREGPAARLVTPR
jgi:hypothetical protein